MSVEQIDCGSSSKQENGGYGEHFRLDEKFLNSYIGKKPNFGFNGLGEFVFYRTYSRIKEDGSKETFLDVITRVIEGCYEIQRRHCNQLHIPWDYTKALISAREMFQRMWDFKFLPPGRGLWMMGTKFMWERGSAALNNCSFISTSDLSESDQAEPFCFLMDMSMLGVGVGFDTKGAGKIKVVQPNEKITITHIVADSREGWVTSVRKLLRSYITDDSVNGKVVFDYSAIRKAGEEIKGFGGKASGPKILKELHNFIDEHLSRKIGQTLNSVDITDIMNYIGRCVVAGNIRRSSEIAFGEPDDIDYCSMKNPTKYLNNDEITEWYSIVNGIYAEQRNYATLDDFKNSSIPESKLSHAIETWNSLNNHRWASNNSILAKIGMDYEAVGKQIGVNGEPGLLWLDTIRDYGRMIDGKQPGIDGRVLGSNPCFSGDMRLFTDGGHVPLYDLWQSQGAMEYDGLNDDPLITYGSQSIVNRNGVVKSTNVYRTGCDVDLWEVIFDDNSSIKATENHNFIVLNRNTVKVNGKKRVKYLESRVHLRDLNVGDMIPLNQTVHFGTFSDQAYAELAGWCIGDGSLSPKSDGQVHAECTCYNSDAMVVLPKLRGLMLELYEAHNKSSHQSPVYAGWSREQDHFDHDEVRIGSNVLGRLLRSDGVITGDKHRIPNSIWNGTRETVAAFLRGLASADGGVQTADNGTISVRISQSNKQLLIDCRLLLNQFGIASTVQFRRKADKQLMNDGKGSKKLYNRKENWELIISGMKQVRKFIDNIGFIQDSKMSIARDWLVNHKGSNNSDTGNYVKIKQINYVGKGDTFCLTEPGNNQVVIEGYEVGQCVEQSLESGELCNLVESFPTNHENAEDYMRTLKFAYLYAKTVTLLPTHNRKTNQIMLRNRRIGLSQSGIVQAFKQFGRRAMLRDFCDAGYNEIRRWDQIYSDWLCVPKSIKVTSVKPSGTVSIVVGVAPGIHHPEGDVYWRTVRVAKNSEWLIILERAGYKIEQSLTDSETMVVYFGINDKRVRPVDEVNMWEQMQNTADYQKYWADNQVSCTIKFKAHEAKEIPTILAAYEDQIKGISFLPHESHGYKQAPYIKCTEQEVEEYNSKIKDLDYGNFLIDASGSVYCDNDKCTIA